MTPHLGRYITAWFLVLHIAVVAALAAAWLVSAASALTNDFSLSAATASVSIDFLSRLLSLLAGFACAGLIVALIGGGIQFPLGALVRRLGGGNTPFILLGGIVGLLPPLLVWSLLGRYIRHGGWGSPEAALFALVTIGSLSTSLTATLTAFLPPGVPGPYSFRAGWFRRVFLGCAGMMTLALYAVGWVTPRFAMGHWKTPHSAAPVSTVPAELNLKGPLSASSFVQYGSTERNEHPRVVWQETGRVLYLYQDDRTRRCLATGEISPDAKTITLHLRQPSVTRTLQRCTP